MLGKIAAIWRCPLPSPPPRGREQITAGFAVAGGLKSSLDLQSLIAGRLKSKKQPAQPIFLTEPLTQQPPRPLSRGKGLERGQQAARLVFGAVRVFGKDCHDLGECPLPNPPPRGREQIAADSGVAGRLKKECPKYQRQKFFRQPLSQGRWNKRRKRFFRRPLNPSVGCVPQGAHAVGWGCRENGERVRAYRTHSLMRATACFG